LKEEGSDYLFSRLKENELRFNWLTAKFSASYSYEKKMVDFKGQLRICKDSLIWVSITPAMGIEMIRLVISNDSIKFINRFNKTYFLGDFALVNQFMQTNVDFDILQSFIIGNDFQFYENASFRASIDNQVYKLSTLGRRKIKKEVGKVNDAPLVLIQNIWLNPETFKITKVDVKEYQKENKKLEASYTDFTPLDGQIFPSIISFNITSNNLLQIMIKYTKVETTGSLTFPFSIPEKYDRIKK
jgi:hypothetical protein